MKILNNAICISAYVTTSEALAYGEAGGLEIESMLEVINSSSGQNFATKHLFPKYVATGNFDQSGAEANIVEKILVYLSLDLLLSARQIVCCLLLTI
jgi:3-hydroxyisobutyrate dehydrogenase-like beta-hydroxyacid dehydrogenase